MIRLFEFLWHGCWHKWAFLVEVAYWGDGFGRPTEYPSAYGHQLVCEKCARVKTVRA